MASKKKEPMPQKGEPTPVQTHCGYDYRLQGDVVQCGPLPAYPPGMTASTPRHGRVTR